MEEKQKKGIPHGRRQTETVRILCGPGARRGADGDTARSHDGGVKDSFPGRDVASITPFPGQPQRSVREVSADTRIRPGDNNTLADQGHTLMEY